MVEIIIDLHVKGSVQQDAREDEVILAQLARRCVGDESHIHL
jgi:hypothetical protein